MQYTVTRGEKGKIEVKVDVPKVAFDEAYGDVVKKLGAGVKVDGFRPGQVPADVLEQKIGANKILNETASFLISKHLGEIFDKEAIVPIANPKIAVDSLSKGTTFSFVATLWNKPKVKVGDWKKIKVKKIAAKEVEEKDVEDSIKNIFEAWKKQKETKGAEESKSEESGKVIYDAKGNAIPVKENKGSPSTNAQDKMDDEFAKAIGARDLTHLRELVKKDLETIVADNVEQKLEEEVFDQLLTVGEVEIPELLVEDELNRILVRLNSQLDSQGKTLDDFLKEEKLTLDELKAKWRPQAEKNVKVTLIMDEIGKSEKVSISREEIDEAMKGVNQQNIDAAQRADLERYLAVSIFQAKTLDLVKKTVSAA